MRTSETIKTDIIRYLTKIKNVATAKEIADYLQISVPKVSACCIMLVTERDIDRDERYIKGQGKCWVYYLN